MTDYFKGVHEEWKDEQSRKTKCWLCKGPLNSFNKKSGGLCSSHSEVPVYVVFSFCQRSGVRVELLPDHKEIDEEVLASEVVEAHTKDKEYTRLIQITIPRREFDKIWIFQQGVGVREGNVNLFASSGFLGYHFLDTFFVQIPTYVLQILFEHPEMFDELKRLSEGVRLPGSITQ